MEEEEKFSEDPEENTNLENEFLKLKLKAQFGDNFFMGGNAELPAEIENQFLKSLISFEENYKNTTFTTIYEKIGKPEFVAANKLTTTQFANELEKLFDLLELNNLRLDICDGPYPDNVIYTFITEELFNFEIETENMFGGTRVFVYEEFYPNHKAEIENNATNFLNNWFNRQFNNEDIDLADEFVTANGQRLEYDDVYKKLNMFFESFTSFKNSNFAIDSIAFDFLPGDNGIGHAEGFLSYDAVLDNQESINFKGGFKLYMERSNNYWSVFYFIMPGFKW